VSLERFPMLPLGTSQFYILLVLAAGERHGLAISKEVETATNGMVRLIPGVLYRHLKQMEADGWITEVEPRDGGEGGVRRYYRLTPRGRAIVSAEAARLDAAVRMARRLRLLSSPA
jgi:DNA-binding PadR family transcriptional regulator